MALPQERPATLAELADINSKATTASESVTERVRAFHKAIEHATAQATERFSKLDRAIRDKAIDQEVRAATRKLRDVMDEELKQRLRDLGAARDVLRSQRQYFDNPIATLDRETLGDERRDRHATTLTHAGPATLEQAALRALRDNDVHLAAAVVARLHQLPKKDRPFHASEIADRLQPEHVTNMRGAMAESSEAIDLALLSVQSISNPRAATRAKIARGVRDMKRKEKANGAS